jgi:hypothetical protein
VTLTPGTRLSRALIVSTAPVPLPHVWLAALAALGEPVDFDTPVPDDYSATTV